MRQGQLGRGGNARPRGRRIPIGTKGGSASKAPPIYGTATGIEQYPGLRSTGLNSIICMGLFIHGHPRRQRHQVVWRLSGR